jgi:hypothetical protein
MDPTKSFDHLDPKLKETYARVMGTAGDNASVPAPADPLLSTTPTVPMPTQPLASPSPSQFNVNPLDQTYNPPVSNPNPGTGPTVNTVPIDTSTTFAPPAEAPAPSQPAVDQTAPTTSSFFSNPSPTTIDTPGTPTEMPTDPSVAQTPLTPYTPENIAVSQPSVPNGQFTQPLPSPASVAHTGPHQTSALLKVLYIVAAVVFFAVYTIFWIKVFNLPFIF